ncbi:hypothetical protein PTI45_04660 [Paenibacillus nuruki]|uniref:Tubulin-like protein TubZ-like C-terminal domain-containing protein n=1 Tax=Paenibacillus nuruki TaxID=1886670 RepID=A0A1E3KYM4_9BACL|nr:hypothetical protein [Paenibacillus nuruki]ODP26005.1 hypothetical protein PTI45_04660 [Paenibacillus nuruki]
MAYVALSNSKELAFMTENNLINELSIRFGFIGAGQKGNKEADLMASYTYSDGSPCYPTLAVNFSKGDMQHLKNIPVNDQVHFEGFKGAARTPSLVVEAFDPAANPEADELRQQLADAMVRKFMKNDELLVDHIIISAGGGGGFGTGFISVALNLLENDFFPVPVSFLISLPSDDLTEKSNALVLINEIDNFRQLQDELFSAGEIDEKPLGSIILTDNKRMINTFTKRKGDIYETDKVVNWKEAGNHVVLSAIHEVNIIPANFGSDNTTYDPSDLAKLFQNGGGYLSIHKSSIKYDKKINTSLITNSMKGAINNGYFSCDHFYDSASMYGVFILRSESDPLFKDISTELDINSTIKQFNSTAEGKFGDPIWYGDEMVLYSIFSGMIMPERIQQLNIEYTEGKALQEEARKQEVQLDLSAAIDNVQKNKFNPYKKSSTKKSFGSATKGFGSSSAFSRAKEEASVEVEEVKNPITEEPKTSVLSAFAKRREELKNKK